MNTTGQRTLCSCLLVATLAAEMLLADPATRLFSQDNAGPRAVVVRAQSKPDKPWKEYPVRTLEQLTGYPITTIDSPLCRYGGRPDRKGKGTGFFTVEKFGDRWWFLDPEGCPYYSKAVVSVTLGKSPTAAGTLVARFGDMKGWADSTLHLLREHGFNGTGAWGDDEALKKGEGRLPYTVVWNFMSKYGKRRGGTFQQAGHTGYPNDCIFVFDPAFESFCDEFARQLAETKDDPYLLGHFSDNELPLPADALDRYLQLDPGDAGYQAAEKHLRARHGDRSRITDADRSAFIELVADRYFGLTSRAIKKHDPSHLFLGARFHAKVLALKPVFVAAGRYVDVLSINYYNTWTPDAATMKEWAEWSGRPFIVTEWYVKGADAGMGNTSGAGWIVPTQLDRGLFYQNFALALLESKSCVGWHWFRYMDNDPKAEGVDPSNTDANKGIVSVRFDPYLPLLQKMKELNQRTYRLIEYFDAGRGRQ